jgi:ABC-type transport system involved in multi-copper enzyme maturation permease subunit
MRGALLLAEKEIRALVTGRRGLVSLFIYCFALSCFSLLLVSNREMSLLDNTAVVYMMAGIITGAGALVALILGGDSYAGERERGTLIPLLVAPITRKDLLAGKLVGLLFGWVVMFLLALPYLWSVCATGAILFKAAWLLALFGSPVILGFGLLVMAVSARTGNVVTSVLTGLLLLLLFASPAMVGPGLRETAIGHLLDAANPFSAALNTYDSVIVDFEPLGMQVPRLALIAGWFILSAVLAAVASRKPRFRS